MSGLALRWPYVRLTFPVVALKASLMFDKVFMEHIQSSHCLAEVLPHVGQGGHETYPHVAL